MSGEEIEVIRPRRHPRHLERQCRTDSWRGGTIVAAVSTFHDVTHRRRVEQHLRQVQQMEAVGGWPEEWPTRPITR